MGFRHCSTFGVSSFRLRSTCRFWVFARCLMVREKHEAAAAVGSAPRWRSSAEARRRWRQETHIGVSLRKLPC